MRSGVRAVWLASCLVALGCSTTNVTNIVETGDGAPPLAAIGSPDGGPSVTDADVVHDSGAGSHDASTKDDAGGEADAGVNDAAPDAASAFVPRSECVGVTYNSSLMPTACALGTDWGCAALEPDGGRANYGVCPQYAALGNFQVAYPDGGTLDIGPVNGNGTLVCCAQGVAGP